MRGLSPTQQAVILEIREGGGYATIDDVASRTRLPRNRVVAALRGLVRDGWVGMRGGKLQVLR
jgi:DNA-binding MarR family transcriptional regulator